MVERVLLEQFDLTGGVNIRDHAERIGDTELQVGDNATLESVGEINKRLGSRVMRSGGSAQPFIESAYPILNGYRFYSRNYLPCTLAAIDNLTKGRVIADIDRDDDFTDAGIATWDNLSLGGQYDFAAFQNLCVVVNGKDSPKVFKRTGDLAGVWEDLGLDAPTLGTFSVDLGATTGDGFLPPETTYEYRLTTGIENIIPYQSGPAPSFAGASDQYRATTDAAGAGNKHQIELTNIPNPGSGKVIHIYRAQVVDGEAGIFWRIKTLTGGTSSWTDDGKTDQPTRSSLEAIDNWAPTASGGIGPRAVAFHQGRLWIAQDADVYYSGKINPYLWNQLNGIRVGHAGDPIVKLFSFYDSLLVFKRDSLWAMAGDPLTTGRLVQLSGKLGCCAPKTVCSWGPYVFFMDDSGVYALSRAVASGFEGLSGLEEPITENIWPAIRDAGSKLDLAAAAVAENKLYLGLCDGGADYNNTIWVGDLSRPYRDFRGQMHLARWTRWRGALDSQDRRPLCASCFMHWSGPNDSRQLYAGSAKVGRFIRLGVTNLYTDEVEEETTPTTTKPRLDVLTKRFDMGSSVTTKRLRKAVVHGAADSALSAQVRFDGTLAPAKQTIAAVEVPTYAYVNWNRRGERIYTRGDSEGNAQTAPTPAIDKHVLSLPSSTNGYAAELEVADDGQSDVTRFRGFTFLGEELPRRIN